MIVVFVVGAPGVGKTTLLEGLLDVFNTYEIEKPKWTISDPFALVGHYQKKTFGGGDTLGYTQGGEAVDYMLHELIQKPELKYLFLDGDRMSTKSILKQVREAGIKPFCWFMTATDKALADRCSNRGSSQNPTWAKGRKTKAQNFASLFSLESRVEIDTTAMSAKDVHSELFEWLGCA